MRKLTIFAILFITNICYSQNWIQQNSGTVAELLDVFFINPNTGYVSGYDGTLLKTTNSGDNWLPVPGPYTGAVQNIVFFNVNTGIAFSNPIYKTTNAGSNWFQVANLSGTLHHCMAADSSTAYGCQPFMLSKTSDKGSTWGVTGATPAWITISAYFINAATGWVTTVQPQGTPVPTVHIANVGKTTNGGTNWITIYTETGPVNSNTMYDIYFPTQDTGYMIGKQGTMLYKTVNGGVNWSLSSLGFGNLNRVFFINASTGWVITASGVVLKTIDGGQIWTYVQTPVAGRLNDIRFINTLSGWVVGVNGAIIKTTNGGVTFVNQISNQTPEKFTLSQNYPNPFNPVTKIKFDIPVGNGRDRSVRLIIYDILGREVAILVNEELKPGTYEADWNAAGFSSGVYFYKIVAGDYTETKKMVLMK